MFYNRKKNHTFVIHVFILDGKFLTVKLYIS